MPGDFFHYKVKTASKDWRCQVCSRIIPKGGEYFSLFGREKKETFWLKVCHVCASITSLRPKSVKARDSDLVP